MNFLDLCAGIGGFRLGMERAGHKCAGYVEIDRYARQSYQAMYDTEGEWTAHDITAVTDEEIRGLARERKIDIITGGFPCQSFSIAGKRLGFADTRGNIFFEICRFIRIIQPRYFICENVKGLLSHDGGRTFGTILRTLAELGYCVEWQILNSKNFGVPQNRERVYIVGHFGADCGRKIFPVTGSDRETSGELQELTRGMCDAYRTYSADGISRTLKSEGGGLGAKTGLYAVPELIAIQKKGRGNGTLCGCRIRRLTPRECWRLQGFPDELFDKAAATGLSDTQLYKQAGNAVTVNVVQAIGERIAEMEAGR